MLKENKEGNENAVGREYDLPIPLTVTGVFVMH